MLSIRYFIFRVDMCRYWRSSLPLINCFFSISWTLYDHDTVERIIRDNPDLLPLPEVNIPLDRRWNKGHVNNAVLQGILQGDSIPKIAQRLENILGMDHNAAVRSARTATTAAECAGRLDTYKYAESLGIKLQKQWLATLDDRTRHAHRQLDGQTVDIGKNFEIDGYELEYPGDPKTPGYLIYNCRCTTITVDKFHDKNAPRASKLGDMSYEDWKAGKDLQLQKVQREEEKHRKIQLKNEENRAILKAKIDSREYPLQINKGRQRKHIEGTHEYETYLAQRLKDGKTPQGKLTVPENSVLEILQKYYATGNVTVTGKNAGNTKIVEYVTTDIVVGQCYEADQYINSKRLAIHYSKRGAHMFPGPER